ncbi:MAG TPA: hypothetical protein VH817_12820 [Thermoleophilaceae bacterium]
MSRQAAADEPEHVIVLRTQGAPQRGVFRGRVARKVEEGDVESVPTARVSIVRAEPFESDDAAEAWLNELRGEKGALEAEAARAAATLNRFLRAHRAAAADPWGRDVSPEHALVVRVGYGDGDQVAEGRYASAYELPRKPRGSRKRDDLAPAERLAALIGGREEQLACEELVLRARADLDARRPREAALQTRIALEAVLAELDEPLDADRAAIGEAANQALKADPSPELQQAIAEAVASMEAALRKRRLRSQLGTSN